MSPCTISVYEVGKFFHTFPKGFFKSQCIPPSLPKVIIDTYIKKPSSWSFKTKTGKTFQVPTLPTFSPKGADTFTRFCSTLFFDFKSKVDKKFLKDSRIPKPFVQLYINNMVLHFKTQTSNFVCLKHTETLTRQVTGLKQSYANLLSKPIKATSTTTTTPHSDLTTLQAEITTLRAELAALKQMTPAPSFTLPKCALNDTIGPWALPICQIARDFTSASISQQPVPCDQSIAVKLSNGCVRHLLYHEKTLTISMYPPEKISGYIYYSKDSFNNEKFEVRSGR